MKIENAGDFVLALSKGPYSWPGAYPIYFVMQDGEALSWKAASENAGLIITALDEGDRSDWKVVGCDVNWEDTELFCVHTGNKIPSAYGDDDA